MSQDVKIFDLRVWESKKSQTEDFSIQGHGFRMLKALNRIILNTKTSDSKLLTFETMSPTRPPHHFPPRPT